MRSSSYFADSSTGRSPCASLYSFKKELIRTTSDEYLTLSSASPSADVTISKSVPTGPARPKTNSTFSFLGTAIVVLVRLANGATSTLSSGHLDAGDGQSAAKWLSHMEEASHM